MAVGTGVDASQAASGRTPQIAKAANAIRPSGAMIHAGRIFTSRLGRVGFSRGYFFGCSAFPSPDGSCPADGPVRN